MSNAVVVDGSSQSGSCASKENDSFKQPSGSSSDIPGPSGEADIADNVMASHPDANKQAPPIVPGTRKEEFSVCWKMFKMTEVMQHNKLYQAAFCQYMKLTNVLSNDALLWLRITECCIYARYERKVRDHYPDYPDGLAGCFLDYIVPCALEEELDDQGMTMDFAEVTSRNCELLLERSQPPPQEGMIVHVKILIAFLRLKAFRVLEAQRILEVAFRQFPKGQFHITALVMQIRIFLQLGQTSRATSYYDGLTDYQRAECRKCFNEVICSQLKIA